jgi:hypothetical protein
LRVEFVYMEVTRCSQQLRVGSQFPYQPLSWVQLLYEWKFKHIILLWQLIRCPFGYLQDEIEKRCSASTSSATLRSRARSKLLDYQRPFEVSPSFQQNLDSCHSALLISKFKRVTDRKSLRISFRDISESRTHNQKKRETLTQQCPWT